MNAHWQEGFSTNDGQAFFLLVAPSIPEMQDGPGWARHLRPMGIEVTTASPVTATRASHHRNRSS